MYNHLYCEQQKGWNRFRSNVENDSPKSYCKRAVAVPFLDDINSHLQEKLQDRNHANIFSLLPSVISTNVYDIDEATELLFQGYKNEMVDERVDFSSEVRRWFNLWSNKSYRKKQKNDTTQTHADVQSAYMVEFHEIVLLTF